MKARLSASILLASAVVAFAAAACRGEDVPPPPVGPSDVIAFGAREAASEGRYGLYLMRPDGSGLQKLADETGFIYFPRWSPDGDRIAYLVGTEGLERPGTLRIYDFHTNQATIVSGSAIPSLLGPAISWSPDGRRLAFVEGDGDARIQVFDVERGELVLTSETPGTAPDWSPARDELALVSSGGSGGEIDLHLVGTDGGDLRRLLERQGLEGNPTWSPDGERFAFWGSRSSRPDERELFVVERDSGQLTDLGAGFAAAWNPDGRRLAYTAPTVSGAPGDQDIFLIAADGGEPRPLSASPTLDRWPTWSPAGDRLAYSALADVDTAFVCVMLVEPEDRDCPELPGLVPAAPAWSPR